MPRKVVDKLAGMSEMDREAADRIRGFAKQFGRAVQLSALAGSLKPGSSVEDEAIAAADKAWDDLACDIIIFAMEEDE